ncbi:MAG: diguanylate cyclase [Burkholderiaceae bacterium]|nr:diguanylate cyclase [Burkholderiaceae bacterium]
MPPERQSLIRALFEEYLALYAQRDERLLERFSERFSGYTGSSEAFVRSRDAWLALLRQDFAQFPEPLEVELIDVAVQELGEAACLVTALCAVCLPLSEGAPSRQLLRHVQALQWEGTEWKIVHSSSSLPFPVRPQEGEAYPVAGLYERNRQLEALAAERAQALRQVHAQLQAQAQTDAFTGLLSRPYFDQCLAQEWQQGLLTGQPLALLLIEPDGFQDFHDQYGLLAAEACLKALARTLEQTVEQRAGSRVARLGGQVFAVLLRGTAAPAAQALAQRIRKAVQALDLPHEGLPEGHVSVSLGVASLRVPAGVEAALLVRTADQALRAARRSGSHTVPQASE